MWVSLVALEKVNRHYLRSQMDYHMWRGAISCAKSNDGLVWLHPTIIESFGIKTPKGRGEEA
jgi:hypothetical protein